MALALACVVLCTLPAASMGAKSPKPRFSLVTKSQAGALDKGRLRVQVKLSKAGTVRLGARLADEADLPGTGKRSRLVSGKDVKFSKRKHKRTISLKLTSSGRKIVERARDACAYTRVKVYGIAHQLRPRGRLGPTKGRFGSRSKRLQRDARTCAAGAEGATYRVGAASRSMNPTSEEIASHKVFLGGYGIGNGTVPGTSGRPATGLLGNGLHVRAFAVSDGTHPAAIADVETQGWFAATKDGPLGIVDMRREVERRTGGKLKASEVMIQSDHTHGGPDMLGVWGGVPKAYRQRAFNQTVDAVVDAYQHMRPGTLRYGTADGADLLANQFDYDAQNKVMDSDVRVLQARDASGRPFATLLNFSAHATVLGSGNTNATGDWVQAENEILADRLGGEPVTVVGTLGRTQPKDRPGCSNFPNDSSDQSLCKIGEYGGRVADRVEQALANAKPITGDPVVAARSYLIQDPATNVLIMGLEYGGDPVGAPLNRASTPPWFTANVLGTVTGSVRIGDVLLSAVPGEIYPQIALKVRQLVPGIRGWMTAGLANDQLGYIIAPYTSYPEPIRRSFFGGDGVDDVPDSLTPDPIGNDNYFFNVSHTLGERVTCSALRGAGEVFDKGNAYRDADDQCPPFANDLLLAPGADAAQGSP